MDQQTRATFVLAAATLAAAKMQVPTGQAHNNQSVVSLMIDILHEMEKQGVIPAGVEKAGSQVLNFRPASPAK